MNIGLWWNGALELISYKPSNQRHAGTMLAGLGICNKWGLCQHVHCGMQGKQCQRVSPKALQHICPSKCLVFSAIFFIYYACVWIEDGILFSPSAYCINSCLISLCRPRVRPYLPLSTLSPVDVFQISDRICPNTKEGAPVSQFGADSVPFKFVRRLIFYRNKHVHSAHWVNSTEASGVWKTNVPW